MDKIIQYHKLSIVKPEYSIAYKPYMKPSPKKIILNGKELELYYSTEFGSYVANIEYAKKVGGKDTLICTF